MNPELRLLADGSLEILKGPVAIILFDGEGCVVEDRYRTKPVTSEWANVTRWSESCFEKVSENRVVDLEACVFEDVCDAFAFVRSHIS